MPRLWTDTIATHREEVREAILDTAAELVAEHGMLSITMSQIAETTGIGRATLYKYFRDVEAILRAWHERQITGHLAQLADVRDRAGDARARLEAVLGAYALIVHEGHGRHDSDAAAFLHHGDEVDRAQRELRRMVSDLIAAGADAGLLRDDAPADELATFCLHALGAASSATSKAAVQRLVAVTMAGLRAR